MIDRYIDNIQKDSKKDSNTSVFTIYNSQKVEKVQFSINTKMDDHHMVCTYL